MNRFWGRGGPLNVWPEMAHMYIVHMPKYWAIAYLYIPRATYIPTNYFLYLPRKNTPFQFSKMSRMTNITFAILDRILNWILTQYCMYRYTCIFRHWLLKRLLVFSSQKMPTKPFQFPKMSRITNEVSFEIHLSSKLVVVQHSI